MPLPHAETMLHNGAAQSHTAESQQLSTINPFTGLSTDYLNHFTEAVMVLEMGTTMPDCLEDLRAWRPKTYSEHFASSRFRDRDAVIKAYEATDPVVRDALDSGAQTLNAVVKDARDAVLIHLSTPHAEVLAHRALVWIKPLIARLAGIINGPAASDGADAQAAIDALLTR